MEDINDIFAAEEARLLTEALAEITKEDAAWRALSPEEREAKHEEWEARWAAFDNAEVDYDDAEQDDDDDQ